MPDSLDPSATAKSQIADSEERAHAVLLPGTIAEIAAKSTPPSETGTPDETNPTLSEQVKSDPVAPPQPEDPPLSAVPLPTGAISAPVPCIITFPELPEFGSPKQVISVKEALDNEALLGRYAGRKSLHPACNCGLRVVIRNLRKPDRRPRRRPYCLARTPGSKHRCDRFSRNPTRPRVDSVNGRQELQAPGLKKFRAGFSIFLRKASTNPERQHKKSHSSGRTNTPSITELGIVQDLQMTARTHCMTPQDYEGGRARTMDTVLKRLESAATDYRISRRRLNAISHFAHGEALLGDTILQEKLNQAAERGIRGIFVVGVARSLSQEIGESIRAIDGVGAEIHEDHYCLKIDGLSEPIQVPAALKVDSQRRFKKIVGNRHILTLVIVWVEVAGGALVARRLAWQFVNPAGIPVASKHEARVANLLVSQRRLFEKPLRETYRLEDATVQPDFILVDTPEKWYLEVWGMRLKKYKERRKIKTDAYRKNGKKLWEWVAHHKHAPPPFPAATGAPLVQ